MQPTPIRALLTTALMSVLLVGSRSVRSQPAPPSSAESLLPSAQIKAPVTPSTPPSVRLLEIPVEASLEGSGTRANELAKKANGLMLERRSAEAEELYKQAWALKPSYDIAGNLSVAESENGKHSEAAEHLLFALRHFPFSASQERLPRLLQLIATERTHVVMLIVNVNLAGAEVLVDDTSVGVAPLHHELFVEPGPRRIRARQTGYTTAEASVSGELGTAWGVDLTLEREPPSRPAPQHPTAPPPPEPSDDWPIRVGVVGLMMTIALYVIAKKALPWLAWMRVRLSRRWKRLHPGRRRLVARSHRRR
jgi:hypothetical protein